MLAIGLAQRLHDKQLAVYDPDGEGGDCFIGWMPPEPIQAIAIMPLPGEEPDPVMPHDSPSIQIIVRGTSDTRTGYTRARALYSELHGLSHVELPNGIHLIRCDAMQSDPIPIGTDDNGHFEYSLNFECDVVATTTQRP